MLPSQPLVLLLLSQLLLMLPGPAAAAGAVGVAAAHLPAVAGTIIAPLVGQLLAPHLQGVRLEGWGENNSISLSVVVLIANIQ